MLLIKYTYVRIESKNPNNLYKTCAKIKKITYKNRAFYQITFRQIPQNKSLTYSRNASFYSVAKSRIFSKNNLSGVCVSFMRTT